TKVQRDFDENRQDSQLNGYGAPASGARSERPALQAQVPDENGTEREPEKDPRHAQGHCARQDNQAREADRCRKDRNGEEVTMAETTQTEKKAGRRKILVG